MNRAWKKLFTLGLSACLVAGLCACGTGKKTASEAALPADDTKTTTSAPAKDDAAAADETAAMSNLNEPGTYPIVKTPTSLSIMIMAKPYIEDYNTNDFTKYMEDLTGLDLIIEALNYDDSKEKMNLAMSGGDYPDVIMSLEPDVVKYGIAEGMFLPLNDMIEQNMPNFMSTMGDKLDLVKQSDGNIYGIPGLNEAYHVYYSDKMWVNSNKLGEMALTLPTTTDELYTVCEQYLKQDTKGICFADWSKGLSLNWIMNSFILTPNAEHGATDKTSTIKAIVSPEGKIVSAANQMQYKEGLKYLKSLFDLGALYEGSFSSNEDGLKSLVNQEGEPVLFFPRNYSAAYIDSTASNEMYRHYEVISPVAGPDGTRLTPYYKYDSLYENRFVITDTCENPDAALRFCDWFFTDKGNLMAQYGTKENVDWKWAPEGMVGINGKPAVFQLINGYTTDVQNHDWQVTGSLYATSDFRLGESMEAGIDPYDPSALEKLLYDETKEKMEPFGPKEGGYDILPVLHLAADEQNEISVPLVEVGTYISESQIAFITGKMDLDKDWDTYVKQLDSLGLQTILDTYQTAYER